LRRASLTTQTVSGVVSDQQQSHTKLSKQLAETESARTQALVELTNVARIRAKLEEQHSIMVNELSLIMTPDLGLASMQLLTASHLSTGADSKLSVRSASPSSFRARKRTSSITSSNISSAHPAFYESDEDDAMSIVGDAVSLRVRSISELEHSDRAPERP
jgi:hypothetical protein